jgi:hypothetical protein
MNDLEVAELRLMNGDLSLVFVKNGEIVYHDNQSGLRPLVNAIRIHGQALRGSSLADRIVGRAASLLVIRAQVDSLFASTLSSGAARILERNRVRYQCVKMVKNILNRDGTDICPFERLVFDTDDPNESFRRINAAIFPPIIGQ